MIEYVRDKGWVYSGNCNTCNGGMWYTNPKYAGWRLKLVGNTSGFVEQNQNPMNRMDYKIIDRFDSKNYESVLNKYFNQ